MVVLLVVVVCGAVGAYGADVVAEKQRLEQQSAALGGRLRSLLGKLVVGSIAAVVTLTLNPPGDDWLRLIGSALIAGLGGQAILLSVISARKAASAEKEREAAEDRAVRAEDLARMAQERTEQVAALARERIADLSSGVLSEAGSETADAGPGASSFPLLAEGRDSSASRAPLSTAWAEQAGRFAEEITALATAPLQRSTRERVLAILKKVLRRSDVEEDPIGQLGADRPEILDMIVHELAKAFPRSQPRFESGDISGDDTLADITRRVRERQP